MLLILVLWTDGRGRKSVHTCTWYGTQACRETRAHIENWSFCVFMWESKIIVGHQGTLKVFHFWTISPALKVFSSMHISRWYSCDEVRVSIRVSITEIKHHVIKEQIGEARVYSILQSSGPVSREYKPGTGRRELRQSRGSLLLTGFLCMAYSDAY